MGLRLRLPVKLPVRRPLEGLQRVPAQDVFLADSYSDLAGAERGIRTPTPLRAPVFEIAERVFAVVRRCSPEYENQPRVRSCVRHRTPKFALTAVKLLSGAARGATLQSAGCGRHAIGTGGGLEPPRVAPLDFESSASASSATPALSRPGRQSIAPPTPLTVGDIVRAYRCPHCRETHTLASWRESNGSCASTWDHA
jgi:hypothetical protein